MREFKTGDMFYFPPHRAWGVVMVTHADLLVDYVLMSPTHDDPQGPMLFTHKSDSSVTFTNAIAQGKLQYFPVTKGEA